MRSTVILLFFTFFFHALTAQDNPSDTVKYWETGGTYSFTLNQVSLTNWQAGGENSISGNTLLNIFGNYEKNKLNWKNTLTLAYGLSQIGDDELRKTDDRIEFNSSLGYHATKKWDYTAFLIFRTQFTDGFDYPNDSVKISTFFAPAYLIGGLGMEYKEFKWFRVNISPLSGKITFVGDQLLANRGAFGVEAAEVDTAGNIITEGRNVRYEVGGSIKLIIKKELMENVVVQSQLDLFSNYIENPENFDVNWDFLINLKVNKWLSANLSTNLIYDDDINIAVEEDSEGNVTKSGPRTQFRQIFGAGLNISF